MHRFVILKIKFVVLADGRCFININDVLELRDAFEKYAKSMTVVMPVQDLRKEDIEFFRNELFNYKGEKKLSFCIKNPMDNSMIEFVSMQYQVNINQDILEVFRGLNKYEVYLN